MLTPKQTLHHTSVKVKLHERLRGAQEQRKGGDILHASTITDDKGFCAREFSLLSFLKVAPGSEKISTSLQFTFDMGNAVQEIVTRHLIDLLWGIWKCNHCYATHHEMSLRPDECEQCGSGQLIYHEPRFTSSVTGISGGVDLVIKFPGHDKMRCIELKTMEKDGFKKLLAPIAKHRLRSNLYLRIISESDYADIIDTTESSILYCDKGFGCKDDGTLDKYGVYEPTSPFKEYIIKRDDKGLAKVLIQVEPLKAFREKGVMPQRICSSLQDKRAAKCPVKGECFSGKYQAGKVVKQA